MPYNNGNTSKVDWDKKDRQIIRQNVLNRAVELAIADKIELSEIWEMGEIFYKWVIAEPEVQWREGFKKSLPMPTADQQAIINKIKNKYPDFTNEMIFNVSNSWPNNVMEAKNICNTLKR